jgi:hypothetical protein
VVGPIAQVFDQVFFAGPAEMPQDMGLWGLLTIPGTLLLIALLLALSDWAEHNVVSPRALIVRVATRRRMPPERAEVVVVGEVERLLRRRRR